MSNSIMITMQILNGIIIHPHFSKLKMQEMLEIQYIK